jgi:hypothetical protein
VPKDVPITSDDVPVACMQCLKIDFNKQKGHRARTRSGGTVALVPACHKPNVFINFLIIIVP